MLKSLSYFFITGFYSGLSPKAPGTAGTLCCAILMWVLWNVLQVDHNIIAILSPEFFCLISTLLGLICIKYYYSSPSTTSAEKFDPQEIVVDEFAGYLLTLSFLPPNNLSLLLAFVGFRIFDILKPWPIKVFEKLPGAWGIMADDLVAGVYAGILLVAYRHFG